MFSRKETRGQLTADSALSKILGRFVNINIELVKLPFKLII